ncbi:unnamed protein product [Cylindrotheca closterium]|uniref:Integrase catalytic domain-containing protein n=1 Tax=Cylindrotheca closterium TaxID=2856 RepID=A0AAD2CKL1_9STRA|nr:unnamed protein product [Cylindrotheca closterium]
MTDISSVKKKSAGGNKFWLQVMDNASDFIFSMFLKKKSETSAKMIALVNNLNAKGFKVKKIRCDRAGENMQFQDEAKNEGLGLTFEFTAPNTPQQNGRVERKFATAFGQVCAMMNTARMTETMRGNLWAEAADTATKLDTALVYQRGEQSSHQTFWKQEARFARHLRTFGEMAVIKVHTKIKGKLKDQTWILRKSTGSFQKLIWKFYYPKTKQISSSRDVSWLKKSYGDWKGIKKANTLRLAQEILLETVNDNDITQAPTTNTNDANTTAPEPGPIPTAAAPAETATIPAAQLDSGANQQRGSTRFGPKQPRATTAPIPRWQQDLRTWDTDRHGTQPILCTRTQTRLATANSESGRETATCVRTTEVPTEEEEINFTGDRSGPLFNKNDVANMMMNPDLQWPDPVLQVTEEMMENIVENKKAEDTKYKEPKNFQEAWNHPDKYQRDKWREAIRKEFRDMIRRGFW